MIIKKIIFFIMAGFFIISAFAIGQKLIATNQTAHAVVKTVDEANKTITFEIKNSNKEIVAKNVSEKALSNAKNHQNQDSYTYDIKTKADGSIQSFKDKTSHLDYKLIFTMLVPVFVVMILLNLD